MQPPPHPAVLAAGPAGTPSGTAHRRVWRLAGPIILSNLSVPLLGAVDTAVMGHLPDAAYIGAVAVGALVFNFLYWGFGFLRMGTTGFTAQARGRGDDAELRAVFARAAVLGLAIALLLLAAQAPIGRLAWALVDASAAVTGLAETYFAIRIWGAPATLITYAVLGWLLGTHNARGVLVLLFFLNGLNIALNLLFVVGLGMTIDGVALATVIAEYAALGLGLWLVARSLARHPAAWDRARLLDPARLAALLRVNADIFVRTLCLIGGFAAFTTLSARMGDVTLAANAILQNLLQFTAYGLDGFAHAVEVLAGAALGARDRRDFRTVVRVASLWALLAAGALALLFALAGGAIVGLFTDLPAVRETAGRYLPWLVLLPLVAVWPYQLDGIFIGATRTAAMRNAALASLAVFLLAAWLLVPAWGNDGLWLALTLFMLARAVSLGACYPRLERSIAARRG